MIGEVGLLTVGVPSVGVQGLTWASMGSGGHEHDYVGNWLWDDGGCILWDDGLVIAL